MSTRAGSAVASRQAKQKLLKILFNENNAKKSLDNCKKMNESIHSYRNLRAVYLKKIQEIHPDKFAHEKALVTPASSSSVYHAHDHDSQNENVTPTSSNRSNTHAKFVELQDAWKDYEKTAKKLSRVNSNRGSEKYVEANFTMFGVGCSFADSPEERSYRNEIMDQASRGWFSSGSLPENLDNNSGVSPTDKPSKNVNLCDDEDFVYSYNDEKKKDENMTKEDTLLNSTKCSKKILATYMPGVRKSEFISKNKE